jgi:hypothetical protein
MVPRAILIMHAEFREFVESLEPKFQTLMAIAPVRYASLPRQMPERGIYLLSEGDRHLYVGRTNRIRRRLSGHCRPSNTHFSATFALRVAREETGLLKASYSPAGSHAELVTDPTFRSFALVELLIGSDNRRASRIRASSVGRRAMERSARKDSRANRACPSP